MTLAIDTPLATTPLGRANPVAKLAAAAVVAAGLLVTVDVVTASVVLGAEVACLPFAGVGWRFLARRAWPLPLAAAGVVVSNLVASNAGAETTAAISLRLVAIALPGLVAFAATDPVDLADSLHQQWRVPARVAYGSLAAVRLLPLLSVEWQTIRRARRARGIDAGRSPLAAAALFASAVFGLLVAAIRRATRLAAAMESRGFEAGGPRTVARRQVVRRADWALVAGAAVVVGGANALAAGLGTWHPLLW
ncbi:MAG: energy-coupling factor transporter transmembrane component T family protein [Acidimicrobiales bacterium]